MVTKMSNNPAQNKQQIVLQQQTISTPLPPPEWMEKYKNINSKIVDDILEQYKLNSESSRELIKNEINNHKKEIHIISVSQWHGFIATILIFFFAFFSAICGYEKVAMAFLGISCVGIIRVLNRKK